MPRVSTEDQKLDLQRDALPQLGCHRVFKNRASGARDDRPGRATALSHRQGNFELNAMQPIISNSFLHSARILGTDAERSNLLGRGHEVDEAPTARYVAESVMLATAFSPVIGYEKSAGIAQMAMADGGTLCEAALNSGRGRGDIRRSRRPEAEGRGRLFRRLFGRRPACGRKQRERPGPERPATQKPPRTVTSVLSRDCTPPRMGRRSPLIQLPKGFAALTTRLALDRLRVAYAALVLGQVLTILLYEAGKLPRELAVAAGLATSLFGPLLSFAVSLHVIQHRRTSRARDLASVAATYLVTCLSFAVLYSVISDLDDRAFNLPAASSAPIGLGAAMYFSVVTITTTGYGDISPFSGLARAAACGEIVVGLLYQVFIFSLAASLVSTPADHSARVDRPDPGPTP